MKTIKSLAIFFVLAIALPALAQGNFTETLSVTNSPVNIVVNKNVTSVIIRENAASPTAVFTITPAAVGSAAVNLAAGQAYHFSNGSSQYASGTVLGTIVATQAGPFTFVLLESNSAQVQPGAPASSASSGGATNVTQLNSTTVDTNSGSKSAGTLRVVIATDQPALTNKLLVTPDSVALPANQSVNEAQIGGTNIVTGGVNGTQGVGGLAAEAATAAGNPNRVGGVFNTAPTTLTTGQQGTLQQDASQNLLVREKAVTAGGAVTDVGGFASNGDAVATSSTTLPSKANHIFNGTTFDRVRSPSLASDPTSQTSTARNSIGAQLMEKGSRWGSFSNPAASSQASISWAAEASVRHVADCVSFSAGSTTAPVLTALTINLRDGATGAGTVIHTWQVIIPAATGQNVAPFSTCGLNIVGTTNTAMTLEFSALLTNLIESVSLTGYNVN